MSDLANDPMCLCGDRQSEHRLRRRGCKAADCGCDGFDAAVYATGGIITATRDPAVVQWGAAMEQSTSARLRAAERELAEAYAEIERLRSAAAHRPGAYHLTDQGRAALAADPKEPS
jgi:hypothetical protein